MRSLFVAVLVAIVAVFTVDAWAQTYRWMDSQGRVHYTQTPPPSDAQNAEKKDFGAGNSAASLNLPYATQVAQQNFPVTLYTWPGCESACEQARSLLVKRTVPFVEKSVVTQEESDQLKKISGGTQLPFLLVGRQQQVGFSADAFNTLLDAAGYPESGPTLPLEALRRMDKPAQRTAAPAPAANPNAANPNAAN